MSRDALPYLSAALIGGPDAVDFLHAQLSGDVAGMAPGKARFACYCSPRGQVYGLLLVCRRAEDCLVVGARELLPGILQRLRMYVLRARVELGATEEWSVYPEDADAAADDAWSAPGGLAYQVLPSGDRADAGEDAVAGWKARELEAGVAWLDTRTTERFIPQMLGYDALGAVSFSKGCYPGQEIVARARYLGQVKRKPLRAVLNPGEAPALESGMGLSFLGDCERLEATLVDWAIRPDGSLLLFAVAPRSEAELQVAEIDGRSYRCATM